MAEQTCKHKFQLTCKSKIFGIKSCEMRLETGELLTYMPIPDGVRFCFGTIQRFYESEEGQKIIQERLGRQMKVSKTTVRNYEIYDCAKWQSTIGETLMFRQSLGVKNRGLDKCFACGYKFGSEEKPYLGLIKNHSNQFICRECAMKVNPERVRYSEEN